MDFDVIARVVGEATKTSWLHTCKTQVHSRGVSVRSRPLKEFL
jgi:hypothetical protein